MRIILSAAEVEKLRADGNKRGEAPASFGAPLVSISRCGQVFVARVGKRNTPAWAGGRACGQGAAT